MFFLPFYDLQVVALRKFASCNGKIAWRATLRIQEEACYSLIKHTLVRGKNNAIIDKMQKLLMYKFSHTSGRKSIHTNETFSCHFSISVKRSSNLNMDVLKNNSTDILKKTNLQENWNHSYEDKFNVYNLDIDTKGNVCLIENVDIHRNFINMQSKFSKLNILLIFYFRYRWLKVLHESWFTILALDNIICFNGSNR